MTDVVRLSGGRAGVSTRDSRPDLTSSSTAGAGRNESPRPTSTKRLIASALSLSIFTRADACLGKRAVQVAPEAGAGREKDERRAGLPITMVSVGPERDSIVMRNGG